MKARLLEVLRVAGQALVIGVFPLVAGIVLGGRVARWAYGDWLRAPGPFLGGLLVALLQEAARAPAVALLAWLGARLLGPRAEAVVLASLGVGYLYEVLLGLTLDTAAQFGEPGFLLGKLACSGALFGLGWALVRRFQRSRASAGGRGRAGT